MKCLEHGRTIYSIWLEHGEYLVREHLVGALEPGYVTVASCPRIEDARKEMADRDERLKPEERS